MAGLQTSSKETQTYLSPFHLTPLRPGQAPITVAETVFVRYSSPEQKPDATSAEEAISHTNVENIVLDRTL